MQRRGHMRNGMAPENSFGKSGKAEFVDGGNEVQLQSEPRPWQYDCPWGRLRTESATGFHCFRGTEINNDFVSNLHCEHIFNSELSYQLQTSWLHANISAYYST
jgi:hypothetical protein